MFAAGTLLAAGLFVADLAAGSVDIPFGEVLSILSGHGGDSIHGKVVINIRLVKAMAAVIAGAALSLSGLQMQTLFRNPLAGPSVLGLTSGASLGAALFMIGAPSLGGLTGLLSPLGTAGAAWAGAALVMGLVTAVSRRVKDIMVILILGMMFSSGVSALVQILQYMSDSESLKSFIVWTMGSLGDVTWKQMYLLIPACIAGTAIALWCIKPLNLLLLGEDYARSSGLDIRRTRLLIFLSTTLLAGSVTAFCGPVGFIGLAVPHIARFVFSSADHRTLLPATVLTGTVMMLVCDIISKMLVLPINTITSLLGIPVVIWVVAKNRNIV